MRDSNWTLKFNRTAKEAFGHDVEFESAYRDFDRGVFWVSVFALGFIFGVLFV